MSQLTTIAPPPGVRSLRLDTSRGQFAALNSPPREAMYRGTALLVPGFNGSKEDFLPILLPLSELGFEVLAIDLRGQYETGPASSAPAYGLDELAADLASVAETVEGERVHLVGHSYGALVARYAALSSCPALTPWLSVALMNFGPAAVSPHQQARLRLLLEALKTTELPDLWPFLRPQDPNVSAEVHSFLAERWASNDTEALRHTALHMLSEPDRTEDLRATNLPLAVISGSPDETWPEQQVEAMAERLGAAFTAIPGGGHSPNVHQPEAVANALTAFWTASARARVVEPAG